MDVINIAAVKQEIAEHEKQIKLLKQLLDFAGAIGASQRKATRVAQTKKGSARRASVKTKTTSLRATGVQKGTSGKRAKRGTVTAAITAHLIGAGKPQGAADIKKALEEKKIIPKGSKSIYSQLQQMASRGSIKKTKTKKGRTSYSAK